MLHGNVLVTYLEHNGNFFFFIIILSLQKKVAIQMLLCLFEFIFSDLESCIDSCIGYIIENELTQALSSARSIFNTYRGLHV